jgi:hypothetical protein
MDNNKLSYENAILTSIVAGALALAAALGAAFTNMLHYALLSEPDGKSIMRLMEGAVDKSPETMLAVGLIAFTAVGAVMSSLLVHYLSKGEAKLETVPAAAVLLVSAALALAVLGTSDFALGGSLATVALLAASSLGFRQFAESVNETESEEEGSAGAEVEEEVSDEEGSDDTQIEEAGTSEAGEENTEEQEAGEEA